MLPRVAALCARPPKALVDRLEGLVEDVVTCLDRRKNCDSLIDAINEMTGGKYGPQDFFELYAHTRSRDFAEVALMQAQAVATDLTREELIEIFELILSPDREIDATLFTGYLKRCFPNSFNTGLVFFPLREMSTEETADELLLRERLYREGGVAALRAHIVPQAQAVLANPDSPGWAEDGAKSALSEYGEPTAKKG